jgi:hypothetical protein
MKILVCGGRSYSDVATIYATLHDLNYQNRITQIIHGASAGADKWADSWAESLGIDRKACPAKWNLYGRKAGPIRNREMLLYGPDLVVAFPGGRGTTDMVKAATESGIKVLRIEA